MKVTRRRFIAGTGALAGAHLLAPVVVRAGAAFAQTGPDPATAARRRLVVIFLAGGNDGLNTIVPRGDVSGSARLSVYRQVRPSIAYTPDVLLPLDRGGDADHALGLNPKLQALHRLYRDGRVALVQGVDYPKHSYSHFTSQDIWESGLPDISIDSGWLGRHLDRSGIGVGELRGVGIGTQLPLTLKGRERQGDEVTAIPMRFADGTDEVGDRRHAALARFGDHPSTEPLRSYAGAQARSAVELVNRLETEAPTPATANSLANALLTARTLLAGNYGVECVYVSQSGYDTHAAQKAPHENLLTRLDQAIEAFYLGTMGGTPIAGVGPMDPALASRTLVMSTSEFGRRIGENGGAGAAGTDHGAAAPVMLIGPPGAEPGAPRLVPGLHGDHPDVGTTMAPADNLMMTTDMRTVYQAVLEHWLEDPDPGYGNRYRPVRGLFAS